MWGEAVLTATYLTNRSPTVAVVDKTPAELWFGKRRNITNLKVFGSIARLHLRKQIKTKFDSKSRQYIILSFATHGYRLCCTQTRKIIIGRDVVFEENIEDSYSLKHINPIDTSISNIDSVEEVIENKNI